MNHRSIVLSTVLVAVGGVSAHADSLEECHEAMNQRQFDAAYMHCIDAAEQGLPLAQYVLGMMHATGDGAPTDLAKALEWWHKAAEQGHPWGQYSVGFMYDRGLGVAKDRDKAREWFLKAAVQDSSHPGDDLDHTWVGCGVAAAQFELGTAYDFGKGVPKDRAKAAAWYAKAANLGNIHAQFNLGFMYAKGRGVTRDDVQAFVLWSLAESQGDKEAAHNRHRLSKRMTAEQIAEGERAVAEWVNGHDATQDGN